MRVRVKICGITREADALLAADAGADAIGFVHWAGSRRAVTPGQARAIAAVLPPFLGTVALFVDPTADEVRRVIDATRPDLLQFHGDESPAQCEAPARAYLRAARMAPGVDLLDFATRFHSAQALLLDAHVEGYGGGGKAFDWSLIPPSVPLPVVLSGGLNAANVIEGLTRVRPWAVDVSSGVESAKGIKDAEAMRRFCDAVREADARRADHP